MIRENIDLERPQKVGLIFDRHTTQHAPGRFRTRALTQEVISSLQVGYKNATIKQYFQEDCARRTDSLS